MKNITISKLLNKLRAPGWLVLVFALVIILRIPSFFEPFSYGDEMIYLTLGEAIKRGMVLYRDIHDNKPPLLYILAAVAGNVFWFRAILAAWSLATIFLFWKLSEALFPHKKSFQRVATIIFAILYTLPLFEGQVANAEVFMIGPIIAGFLILFTKAVNTKNLFFAGGLFSVATLFKFPAAFDLPVILVFWLIFLDIKRLWRDWVRKSLPFVAGFLAPIALTLIWYFLRGGLKEYIIAAFAQNIGYLSSWRPSNVAEPFLARNAPLLIRAAVVGLGTLILFRFRKGLSRPFVFASLWILFSLFAAALSERPYPHYLIQAVPAASILLAMLFTENSMEQVLVLIPLALFVFTPVYYKFWYYPTTTYYTRFLEFASGKIDRQQYFDRFDGNVSRNYKIAEFINQSTGPKDKIFVWGDSPPIYALTRRFPPGKYVATYHIMDFSTGEEAIGTLEKNMPALMVVLPGSPEFRELTFLLRENYVFLEDIEGAEIWFLANPTVRAFLAR
ncbi:hypothetical protein A2115_01400 [Candidatus Woesebacteria bacterium GWA1_41_8]|uniref:Glycosyltransferase RgtA/B/C/D-like domain-containing protein n=1 Tax=Candidatus Woesebacteria bacterium GWA1_41_8 TaxID=1802471 RepID=A0A1F7WK00_9BACT|nr:MAG: hypothetical protein A2115_01400 [Candidatus Woesebacteria bacterium GWA1_41_8]